MRLWRLLLGGFLLKVNEAIVACMEEIGAVDKGGNNKVQGFRFRGVDQVVNAVSPALKANGVVVFPVESHVDYTERVNAKGTTMVDARAKMTYRWVGPEGDHFDVQVCSEARDAADKATAKAFSVAFRTCLIQTLALPTDEPDPDSEYSEVQSAPQGAGQGAAKSDPDVLTILRSAIQADAKAFNVPDEAMGDLVKRAGVKTRVSLCTDQVALQKLADLIRAEHG